MNKIAISLFTLALIFTLSVNDTVAQNPGERSSNIIYVDGRDFYLHTVSQGETLYSISRIYDVPIDRIKQDNPGLDENSLKAGHTIKIVCDNIPTQRMSARKQAKLFTEHTVSAGETTYSIAKRYGISVNSIIEDNPGLDPTALAIGQALKIRKTGIGEADDGDIAEQIKEYAETLNEVSDDNIFYVVRQGDTIYSLSRAFGVSQEDIESLNNFTNGLKAGAIIKIPTTEEGRKVLEMIKREDSTGIPPTDMISDIPLDDYTNILNIINDPFAPLKKFDYYDHGVLDVALLLPFSDMSDKTSNNFVDFYRGVLLALETFKESGYSLRVNVYDTQRSAETISRIVQSSEFRESDLIIGPVYENGLESAIEAAREAGIPLVSPLAAIEGNYGSSLFQMAPDPAMKYEKLKALLTPDKNIILVSGSDHNDAEFEREIKKLTASREVRNITFKDDAQVTADFNRALSDTDANLIVVMASDMVQIGRILSALGSIDKNNAARSKKIAPIEVIGTSNWARYNNLDHELFFRLNVSYITTYFAARSNTKVNQFTLRYINAFSEMPSLYAYRGYDAMRLFGEGMISSSEPSLRENLNDTARPLQVNYRFEIDANGNNVNKDWPLVRYKSDFTIEVD